MQNTKKDSLDALWPGAHSGRAHDRADLVDLVGLAGPREQRPQRVQLRQDRPARPLVDGRVIVGRPQKHLGCSVPVSGRRSESLAQQAVEYDCGLMQISDITMDGGENI